MFQNRRSDCFAILRSLSYPSPQFGSREASRSTDLNGERLRLALALFVCCCDGVRGGFWGPYFDAVPIRRPQLFSDRGLQFYRFCINGPITELCTLAPLDRGTASAEYREPHFSRS